MVLSKLKNVNKILFKLNSYHKNLYFTVGTFDDNNVLHKDVYRQATNTRHHVASMIWNPGSKKLNGQKALYLRASRNCGSAKCFCQKFSIINKFYVQIGMAFRNVSSTSSKSSKLHRTPIIDVEYPLRILITHSLTSLRMALN